MKYKFLKKNIRIVILTMAIFLSALQCFTQSVSEKEENEFWFNFPNTPLRIFNVNNRRNILLGNYSEKTIVKYQLGCIAYNNGNVKMSRRKWFNSNLTAIDSGGQIDFLTVVLDDLEHCKNAKLSVLQVQFANGTKWKANKE